MSTLPLRLLLAAVVFFSALPAHALSEGSGKFAPLRITSALLPSAIPTYGLKKGQLTITLAPAYTTFKLDDSNSSEDASGWGGSGCLTYAFSDWLGIGVLGAGYELDGESGITYDGPGLTILRRGDVEHKGSGGAAFAIFDPLGKTDGTFRLPIMAGAAYFDMTQTGTISSGAANTVTVRRKFKGAVPAFGAAPQFDLGRLFRVVPFAFLTLTVDADQSCVATGSGTCSASVQQGGNETTAAGVSVTFKPWNLSGMYAAPVAGASALSLNWRKSFGGR